MSDRKLKYRPFLFMLAGLAVVHCNNYEVDTLQALQELASDPPRELSKEITQAGVTFRIDYLPPEFLLLREYEYLQELELEEASEAAIQRQLEDIQQYREGYASVHHFRLVITPGDGSDLVYTRMGQGFDSYSQWLQNLLFGIGEEITVRLPDGTEVPLVDYRMERNYGTSPSRTFLLTFPNTWNGQVLTARESLTLEIDEFGLRTGSVKARFSLPFPAITYTHNSFSKISS